jgi:hypothetical protein
MSQIILLTLPLKIIRTSNKGIVRFVRRKMRPFAINKKYLLKDILSGVIKENQRYLRYGHKKCRIFSTNTTQKDIKNILFRLSVII